MIHNAVSFAGFMVFAGIAWLLSSNRKKIAWRTIAWESRATSHRRDHFSLTCLAAHPTLAERRGRGLTNASKSGSPVSSGTTCRKPR
jgi:hypothetical protein